MLSILFLYVVNAGRGSVIYRGTKLKSDKTGKKHQTFLQFDNNVDNLVDKCVSDCIFFEPIWIYNS